MPQPAVLSSHALDPSPDCAATPLLSCSALLYHGTGTLCCPQRGNSGIQPIKSAHPCKRATRRAPLATQTAQTHANKGPCRRSSRTKHVFQWPALSKLRKYQEQVAKEQAGASPHETLPSELREQVDSARQRLHSFELFNVTELARATEHPLKVTTIAAFEHFGLIERLSIDLLRLAAFAEAIEGLYRCEPPPCRYGSSAALLIETAAVRPPFS